VKSGEKRKKLPAAKSSARTFWGKVSRFAKCGIWSPLRESEKRLPKNSDCARKRWEPGRLDSRIVEYKSELNDGEKKNRPAVRPGDKPSGARLNTRFLAGGIKKIATPTLLDKQIFLRAKNKGAR
jgi:hypothetical protein